MKLDLRTAVWRQALLLVQQDNASYVSNRPYKIRISNLEYSDGIINLIKAYHGLDNLVKAIELATEEVAETGNEVS